MAIIQLPKQYHPDFRQPNKKPVGGVEINYKNDIVASADSILLFNEIGRPLNDNFGGDWSEVGADTALQYKVASQNLVYGRSDIDEAGNYLQGPINGSASDSDPFFIIAIYTVLAAPSGAGKGILSYATTATSGGPTALLTSQDTTKLRYFTASGYRFTDIPVTVGKRHILVHRYDGSSGHNFYDSAKGIWETFSSAPGGLSASNRVFIGSGFNAQAPIATELFIFGHGKVPSLAALKSFVNTPYQILKPKSEPVYFTADAAGGTITVPATLGTISYASNSTTVSIAGSIDVTATLGSINYASNNTTVGISGSVDVLTTLGTITYTSNNSVVSVTGSVDVVTTLGTINYTSNNPLVSIGGVVVVPATLGTISYTSNDVVIELQGVVDVQTTLGTIQYASNDAVVSLAGLIDVTATIGTISYTSNSTTVTVAAGQSFGVVGVGFADDIYGSTFKPDSTTVNFRG